MKIVYTQPVAEVEWLAFEQNLLVSGKWNDSSSGTSDVSFGSGADDDEFGG